MRNYIKNKNRGSVESFITLIPQIFVFLLMFQLLHMQFSMVKDSHILQGEVSKDAISGGSSQYSRYPLVGGGSVLVLDKTTQGEKFIDFGSPSERKISAIAVDEDESN